MVSVIIPAHNYARYLLDAVHSVLKQSYTDWECIIIDDGSTDETASVADELCKKDARIRYFYQSKSGPSAARNSGINYARGEYIQFLDADDMIQPLKLQSQVTFMENNPEVDIVYGETRYFKEEDPDKLLLSIREDNTDWKPKISGKGKNVVNVMMRYNILPMNAPLIRNTVFKEVGLFDTLFITLEDWEFWLRCAVYVMSFYFLQSEQSYALVRSHPNSAIKDERHMQKYYLPILQKTILSGKLSLSQYIYAIIRYEEEALNSIVAFLSPGNQLAAFTYKENYFFTFMLLLFSIPFLPFYLLIKIYRKIFQKKEKFA